MVAYPVDYRAPGRIVPALYPDFVGGLQTLNDGVREWYALITYRLFGRSNALFPAP